MTPDIAASSTATTTLRRVGTVLVVAAFLASYSHLISPDVIGSEWAADAATGIPAAACFGVALRFSRCARDGWGIVASFVVPVAPLLLVGAFCLSVGCPST